MRVILWLLCTRLGTLALCGRLCLSGESFPYVRRFADMPVGRREEALRRWTGARWLVPVKIAFAIVKSLCFNVFYTTVRTRTNFVNLSLGLCMISCASVQNKLLVQAR